MNEYERNQIPKPLLMRYEDGASIREATLDELRASIAAARLDGGSGVIVVDGISCYVTGDLEDFGIFEDDDEKGVN